jgi:colanic acid biosynthesis glycosyl transferase WcaI
LNVDNKNILIISNNYYPEKTGIPYYNTDFAEWLAINGFNVKILTAFPYYPEWKINPKYKQKFNFNEIINNVEVIRSPIYVPKKVTSKKRILHELVFPFSFILTSILNFRKIRNTNCIFFMSPSIFLFIAVKFASMMSSAKIYMHIYDIQPDAAIELNMINNKMIIKYLKKFELFIYRKCHLISVLSKNMKRNLVDKGVFENKVKIFPLWADIELFKPMNKLSSFRKKYFQETDFIVGYSGNLGEKQDLDIILKLAEYFKPNNNIKFFITGDGAKKDYMLSHIKEKNLLNTVYLPAQDKEFLNELLCTSDVHLIPMKKEIFDFVLPSKFYNLMACGIPVIAGVNFGSELYSEIHENEIGIAIEPEEMNGYKNGIERFIEDSAFLFNTKIKCRHTAETRYDSKNVISSFINKVFLSN